MLQAKLVANGIKLALCCGVILWMFLGYGRTISMAPKDYRRLVEARCFNETPHREPFVLGQRQPVGLSLDYFVSLVEALEQRLPQASTKEMITLILKRFHFDGTQYEGFQNIRPENEKLQQIINDRIFEKHIEKIDIPFPEDIFTDDEKCAMFFMLSHTVNSTKPRQPFIRTQRDTNTYTYGQNTPPYVPRELGAVGLYNSDRFALSMNSVLLGVAVGLFGINSMGTEVAADSVDPLLAVTFGDKLAMASIKSMTHGGNVYYEALIGSEGKWNSTYCQTEYKLTSNGYNITMADLNGAIDGWLLGRKLMSEEGKFLGQLKLSTILDRFYSKDGLAPDCGICATTHLTSDVTEKIRDNAKGYLHIWNELYNKNNHDISRLNYYVEYNWIQFGQFLQKAKSLQEGECFRLSSVTYGESQCETSSDVFIMVDNNVREFAKFQLEFVTNLLVKLQSANYLGTVTLLTNALRGYDSDQVSERGDDLRIPLHLMAYNTTSVQLATCRLAWYSYKETTINNKKQMLDHLVTMFERNNVTNQNRANAKNFVWLSLKGNAYRPLSYQERMIYQQYRWYFKYFLNIRTFFVSSVDKDEDDDLNDIVVSQEDWLQINLANLFDETIAERLVKRMCDTPVALVYEDCHNHTSDSIGKENLISATKKQYWAVYPKYFLKSETVHMKFKAVNAKIQVCLDRWIKPEGNARRCKEATADGEQVEFWVDHPCRWRTIDTCNPIYFTVSIANKNFLPPNDCFDPRCRTLDQVRWTLTHSGLHCYSGALSTHRPHVWACMWLAALSLMLSCLLLK